MTRLAALLLFLAFAPNPFVRSDAAPQQVDAIVDCTHASERDVDCAKASSARATAPR